MDAIRRENYMLKVAIVLLFCVTFADRPTTGDQSPSDRTKQQGSTQRLPGPGSGVVDVAVVNDVTVSAVQAGEWRVSAAQQGDWRVGVQGTVTTVPAALPFLRVGDTYAFHWDNHRIEVATVREVHGSGWVRVDSASPSRARWINPAVAGSVELR